MTHNNHWLSSILYLSNEHLSFEHLPPSQKVLLSPGLICMLSNWKFAEVSFALLKRRSVELHPALMNRAFSSRSNRVYLRTVPCKCWKATTIDYWSVAIMIALPNWQGTFWWFTFSVSPNDGYTKHTKSKQTRVSGSERKVALLVLSSAKTSSSSGAFHRTPVTRELKWQALVCQNFWPRSLSFAQSSSRFTRTWWLL